MNRQRLLLGLTVILLLSVFQASALSPQTKHIQGLHVVEQLPETMVAGSTYEWQVSFVNPKSESGSANITLEITEEKTLIGFGEFKVEGNLEGYDNPPKQHHYKTLNFMETSGGIFQAYTLIDERFNNVKLNVLSVPNLMPGKYTFTLDITLNYIEITPKELEDAVKNAVKFLKNMYNRTIGLCAEAPTAAPNTYWLVSDNLWAYKALEKYDAKTSNAIKSKLIELAKAYNLPRDAKGLPISYKHEAVIGDTVTTPFNTTLQYTLYGNNYSLKTEIANGTAVMDDWQEYADLLLYAALSKHWERKEDEALTLFNMAENMWNGIGIYDKAAKADGYYSTYKLALLLYTSKVLGQKLEFEQPLIATILKMQDKKTGGIITNYYPSGEPVEGADANTETTSITVIALTFK